jgi:hypothetical protein
MITNSNKKQILWFLNNKIIYFVLIFSVSIYGLITPSSALSISSSIVQANPISVSTDKQSYFNGDIIVISGHVKSGIASNIPVTIEVLNSKNNLVHVEQIGVAKDDTFFAQMLAKGPLWIYDGLYTVRVQYGLSHLSALTEFNFQNQVLPEEGVIKVKDPNSNKIFEVNYTITGGKIKEITIEPENFALSLSINSTDKGSLILKVPRLLIDAKRPDSTDENFLVFINEYQVKDFDDKADSEFRTITINFEHDESKIMVVGTQVVPQFGQTIIPVIIIAMTSMIIISRFLGGGLWKA